MAPPDALIDDFRKWSEKDLLEYAMRILEGEKTRQRKIFDLAMALKSRYTRFGAARKLLWVARSASDRVTDRDTGTKFQRKLAQQHALCTYKDQDLSVETRFERALDILRQEDLRDVKDPTATITHETLGIAGAIYKAKWDAFGQRTHLYESLACYQRGYNDCLTPQSGTGQRVYVPADDGYTAINTAFMLNLIADQEEMDAKPLGAVSETAQSRRADARKIRGELVATLPAVLAAAEADTHAPTGTYDEQQGRQDRVYWLLVTLGEAYAGLGTDDASANDYYRRARDLRRYDWMVESSARQLTSLMRLLREDKSAPASERERNLVQSLVGDKAPGIDTAFLGRVGLALSGGGFRASLFHIGVLARLAELDMLRHVEFLSCVSGGSIIGAYYYLELRKLLQSRTDDELTAEDYVALVKSIEDSFLQGVQKNIRMLAIADYQTNLHHNLLSGALPTERVADLYEDDLYSLTGVRAANGSNRLMLSDLFICPAVSRKADGTVQLQENFRPKEDNWRRRNKVPILVLNATSLNTGHNWQFTATWMGEPPTTVNNEIDGNQRLRRMYYSEAPSEYRQMRLGRAVGASACVPALFAPVEMSGLYPELALRLVDGGVHDNQGVASLLDQGCSFMLVSDASGQLGDEASPVARISKTGLRADEIVQERVRIAQFQDLEWRRRSGRLRALMFIHLKKDLERPPMDWIGCELPHRATEDAKPAAASGPLTSYGIHADVQRALAAIRTDLDAFHQTEAWALITSGYQMTKFHFPEVPLPGYNQPAATGAWNFLTALPRMTTPDQAFLSVLRRSGQRFFKAWDGPEFRHELRKAGIIAAVVLLLCVIALVWFAWHWPIVALAIAVLLVLALFFRWKSIAHHAVAAAMAWAATRYLRKKNQDYLNLGRWPPQTST